MSSDTIRYNQQQERQRQMNDIIRGNAQRRDEANRRESQRAETIMKDTLKRFENSVPINKAHEDKKIAEVLDYYKK